MKKLAFLFILFITTINAEIHSQTLADTLETAYTFFSKKDYKAAATHFDYFLSRVEGHKMDYYFAGVCKANLNEPEKSMDYLNKSANNKAEYIMMLNDPELKAVQPRLKEILSRLGEFEVVNQRFQKTYPRSQNILASLDSIYRLLPPHKLTYKQLSDLAYNYFYQKDTFQYFYYLNEAFESLTPYDNRKYVEDGLEKEVKSYSTKVNRSSLNKLLELGFFRYFYAMTLYSNADSFRYHLSKVPYDVFQKHMSKEQFNGSIDYFIQSKNFNLAYIYMYSGLSTARIDFNNIFAEKSSTEFFKQPIGKTFLTQLLSEYIIPTIETSDKVFVSSAYEYTSSQIEKHDFLQSLNFNSRLPSMKKYLVKRSVSGPVTLTGHSVSVMDNYPDGLFEDELYVAIDSALNVTPVKRPFFSLDPREELVMGKSAAAGGYVSTTGQFYRQPVENISFIKLVKNGKIEKSIIPNVRQQYFKSLVKYGINSAFSDKSDKEDIRYFARVYGYDVITSYIEELLQDPQSGNLDVLLQLIRYMGYNHTKSFSFLVNVLSNPEKYFRANPTSHSESSYYDMLQLAENYIENLSDKAEFTALNLGSGRFESDSAEIIKWKDASFKIAQWWDNYKKSTKYTMPPMLKSTVAEEKGLPPNTYNMLLDASNRPLFFDPSDRKIMQKENKLKQPEVLSIMVEEMDSPVRTSDSNLSGVIVGDSGFVFTPSQFDSKNDLLIIPGLTSPELDQLKQTYNALNLDKKGQSLVTSEYDKSYDKFYACRFNKRLVALWFTKASLHVSYLGSDGKLTGEPNLIHYPSVAVCPKGGKSYQEFNYNLNTIQFASVGNNLLILSNYDMKQNPTCSEQDARIYLDLLGPDLKLLKQQVIPVSKDKDFDSNPIAQMKVTASNIFVFVQKKDGPAQISGAVFNKKLEVVTAGFNFEALSNTTYSKKPFAILSAPDENVYCIYQLDKLGNAMIAINKIGPSGQISKPLYFYHTDGSIYDMKGCISGGNIVVYIIEDLYQKKHLQKIKVPLKALKFVQ